MSDGIDDRNQPNHNQSSPSNLENTPKKQYKMIDLLKHPIDYWTNKIKQREECKKTKEKRAPYTDYPLIHEVKKSIPDSEDTSDDDSDVNQNVHTDLPAADQNSVSSNALNTNPEFDQGNSKNTILSDRELNDLNQDQNQSTCSASSSSKSDPSMIIPIISVDKSWLDRQFHDKDHQRIKKPEEIEKSIPDPPGGMDKHILDRIQGSMIGLALGDALGAHVEFRPHQYLLSKPVTDLEGGGTWGLKKGQFTDDTSMALCLANSLIACGNFNPYDQLVRYKWWYKYGYMSSTGQCFDIGAATRNSILEFENRQLKFAEKFNIEPERIDSICDFNVLKEFDICCSENEVAGNGALMRLAPVPLFFYRYPKVAVEFSGVSGQITHGDTKAYDACRYYGALIVAALHRYNKDDILDKNFYSEHKHWFGEKSLCKEIMTIAEGSYKRTGGYKGGIRGKGYIVNALEAALWAFWSNDGSFEKGALKAVNLGDDTDTTAAIYGQLAGAYYGYKQLPKHWIKQVYAKNVIKKLSKWILYEGAQWKPAMVNEIPWHLSFKLPPDVESLNSLEEKTNLATPPSETQTTLQTSQPKISSKKKTDESPSKS